MPSFDMQTQYLPKGDTFFDDGREIELLHFIYSKPNIDQIRGSPTAVLACIDEYARSSRYLMNVGVSKGAIVTELIAEAKPSTMVELGGYVAYSTILFADALRRASGPKARYFSLERNPEFAAVVASLADLAGLRDVVTVVVGSSDASLARLNAEGTLKTIDFMFLDHYKPAYTSDLKLCEELNMIVPGRTVLAADNVITPGNPPYLEYVRSSCEDKRAIYTGARGSSVDERFNERTAKQYKNKVSEEKLKNSLGNPNLVYESKLVNSFEPTGVEDGVEVTRCLGNEEHR